jgi:hypothetical protein
MGVGIDEHNRWSCARLYDPGGSLASFK